MKLFRTLLIALPLLLAVGAAAPRVAAAQVEQTCQSHEVEGEAIVTEVRRRHGRVIVKFRFVAEGRPFSAERPRLYRIRHSQTFESRYVFHVGDRVLAYADVNLGRGGCPRFIVSIAPDENVC